MEHLSKYYLKYYFLSCTITTILYNLTIKGCTTQFKTFMNYVVRSLHCTTHCTTKYKLLYNIGQYVQYYTNPCTISFSNPFFGCTTFQIVYGVQPFVQNCTTYVQCCTILYRLYRLYNLLYNIVTVWIADLGSIFLRNSCVICA